MLIVTAIGGNALAEPDGRLDPGRSTLLLADVAGQLTRLLERPGTATHAGGALVVTHGNGPQVGALALQQDRGPVTEQQPLDELDALTEGWLGYRIELALRNARPDRAVASLVTLVRVDPDDPAFGHPTKPIGPTYDDARAEHLSRTRGWAFTAGPGGRRRVVPSPDPLEVLALPAIRALLDAGLTVVCAGGGGVPVVPDGPGRLKGVEAVVDKDLTTAALAAEVGADGLLLLTDVAGVMTGFGTPSARTLHKISTTEARALRLPPGSMGPKVEAACRFAEATGHPAAIGRLTEAEGLLLGSSGTLIVAGEVETRWW